MRISTDSGVTSISSILRFAAAGPGFALVVALLTASSASADVRLPHIFGDHMVLQRDRGIPVWGWSDPRERVTVRLADERVDVTADATGKWKVEFAALPAGGPHEMEVAGSNTITLTDILVGEVWVASGQSNMQWQVKSSRDADAEIAAASEPTIRLFTVARAPSDAPQTDCDGEWQGTSPKTVETFSAVAYFFGRALSRELGVPIGLINTSWGGTRCEAWTSDAALRSDADLESLLESRTTVPKEQSQHRASYLYNGMIAPIVPYAIRGAIWYQGESNVSRAVQYRKLFPAMIRDWRSAWTQGDFPFLFVQLAPYRYAGLDMRCCAELWEAQLQTLSVPNTGMAVTMDIGNVRDIHPRNKQDVGKRLALWALAGTYGENVTPSGPIYKSMQIDGDTIRLSFDHAAEGLASRDGKPLCDFTIAGKDQQFLPATARVEDTEVVVRAEAVRKPVAVRYAWYDAAQPNLANQAGLPASPFRTDTWPAVTEGKK